MLDLNNPEEAVYVEKMHDFNKKPGHHISFSYVVRDPDKGTLTFVELPNRPCYGELRAYGKESTRPGDYKPGDLPRPMNVAGKGIREAVSVYLGRTSMDKDNHNKFIEHVWSDRSPWKRGIGDHEFTYDNDGFIVGSVMWGTDVDPTVMVSMFMFLRKCRVNSYAAVAPADLWLKLQEDLGCDENTAIILTNWTSIQKVGDELKFIPHFQYAYYLPVRLDIKGFLNGESRDVSDNITWRDGGDYNRPALQDVFMSEDKSAPVTTTWMCELIGAKTSTSFCPKPTQPLSDMQKIVDEIKTLAA